MHCSQITVCSHLSSATTFPTNKKLQVKPLNLKSLVIGHLSKTITPTFRGKAEHLFCFTKLVKVYNRMKNFKVPINDPTPPELTQYKFFTPSKRTLWTYF